MLTIPRAITAALASLALTVGLPAANVSPASAQVRNVPVGGNGPTVGACSPPTAGIGQMPAGNPIAIACGDGLVFIAPMTGQIASIVGSTIIGPAFVGNLNVSGGAGQAGSL